MRWQKHAALLSLTSALACAAAAGGGSLATRGQLPQQTPAQRRAAVMQLGTMTADQLAANSKDSIVATLLQWYRDDPDAGVHGAVAWLLRHSRTGDVARPIDWAQPAALARVDSELAGRTAANKRWYVTREQQTMVIVPGPVEFIMGSPPDEIGRSSDEIQHRVRIPRSFAVASTEVTIAQFRRFLEANPSVKSRHAFPDDPARMPYTLRTFSPDADGPQIAVTWYEAAMYCNWLSAREGIPQSQWVYPVAMDAIRDGMEMPNAYLQRTGYRLPTEAEWEFAARAGSSAARFFGDDASKLREYAWHRSVAPKSKDDPLPAGDPARTWPVGQLRPNDLGLFDIYGNVWEWLQDRRAPYATGQSPRGDVADSIRIVRESDGRVRRGGGFSYEPAMHRSAHRGTTNAYPAQRRDNVGFRIARTIPE